MLNLILQISGGSSSMISQFVLIGAVVIVFYFFMIRPQQKKQKDQKSFLNGLKEGDSVITIGGLHGKISSQDEQTVVLVVDKGLRLTFEKSAISLDQSKRVQAGNTKVAVLENKKS